MTVTTSCGCTFHDDKWQDVPVLFWVEEVCDAIEGYTPAVVGGCVCAKCRARLEALGEVYFETEEAAFQAAWPERAA